MQYWKNADSGNVIAREFGDEPMGEWFEIDKDEYECASHPLLQDQAGMSKADYRGFEIKETATGCMFEHKGNPYHFATFGEATACIDAMYADAVLRILR